MFVCAQSAPLNQEPIVCADIGTAHSAAVTGEGVCPNSQRGDTCIFPIFLLPVSQVTPSCVSPLCCQPLVTVTPLGATSTGSWAPTPAATAACPTWLWGSRR